MGSQTQGLRSGLEPSGDGGAMHGSSLQSRADLDVDARGVTMTCEQAGSRQSRRRENEAGEITPPLTARGTDGNSCGIA